MQIKSLFSLSLAVAIFIGCSTSNAAWFSGDKIDVVIKVQDEQGKPIPYVTVWHYIKPNPTHIKEPDSQLTMDDLWRVTTRYKKTSEHMLWFGEKAISALRIFEMGDGLGVLKTQINYQTFTGEGNKYLRPNPTNWLHFY